MPNSVQAKISAWPWLLLSLVIIVLDQLSKHLISQHLQPGQLLPILPFLNLTLRFNAGAAFSFLGNAGGWQIVFLIVFVLLVVMILLRWLLKLKRDQYLLVIALSLILGGAMGNLIDRVRWGYVVDFIDFHLGAWHFATFNVADSAVCIGAFLLVVKYLFFAKR